MYVVCMYVLQQSNEHHRLQAATATNGLTNTNTKLSISMHTLTRKADGQ
jgi:hypothetical protein